MGGIQPLAYHEGGNLLLALMHPGGKDTHKNPGVEVWYYNLATGQRVHRLTLENAAFTIQVSQDDAALLYGVMLIVILGAAFTQLVLLS